MFCERHPQQYLAGTAEFTELLKDEPDHLLQPPIRAEAEADVPIPGVTDRTREPQLAALAFDRAASYIRDRMIPSSNSLMLPFIPSNRRSFGRHGS